MQGIYQGFKLRTHDTAWTCLLDLVQDRDGVSKIADVYRVLEMAGNAGIIRW